MTKLLIQSFFADCIDLLKYTNFIPIATVWINFRTLKFINMEINLVKKSSI
jgi:hypothetical protein